MFRKLLIAAAGALGFAAVGCEREEGRTPGGTTRPAPTQPPPPSEQPKETPPPPAPNPPEEKTEYPR